MSKIAIIGGAGFLGSHVCHHLWNAGHEVLCVDNFDTGRKSNIDLLLGKKGFYLIEEDCRSLSKDQLAGVEQIYNMACPASPPKYQRDPLYTLDVCYSGTKKLLEISGALNASILHASTSEVYGDPEVHPQPEGYFGNVNTLGPRSCYDEGKRIAETLCYEHSLQLGTKIRIVRIFNTYGPRMDPDDGRVISNFIKQSLSNTPHTIYGDGKQTRSFCYVSDLVDGLVKIMNLADGFVAPINLGTELEYSINDLSRTVSNVCGVENQRIFLDLPVNDPQLRRPELSRARSLIDWSPRTSLTEGLSLMLNEFIEN